MNESVNILMVDDRPEGFVALEAVLTDPSYTLVKANSGREALAHLLKRDFAAILMDVQMPDMDGFETAKIIRQRDKSKHIPIVFVTAINEADRYILDGYAAGAIDYLFKPFDPQILKSKVEVLVDLYRKNRALVEQARTLHRLESRENARVLAELEIESRRRYQNLADAIPQIIWRADSEGKIDYYNHYWYFFSGLSREQSLENGWCDVVHPECLVDLESKWKTAISSLKGFETECRLKRGQDGVYRWHLLRVSPEFDGSAPKATWIGTALDIHDNKVIQEELRKAKDIADVANEAKSRFLANMSHEIRTPLGAMLGFAELLLNRDLTDEDKMEYISIIRRNGDQLSKIINDILDLSKVEAGRLDVEKGQVWLGEIFAEVKSLMSLSASEKGLELVFKVAGKVPKFIRTDALRLRQILINIIGNGIKFTETGRVEVVVSVASPESEKLFVHVRDSGPGLTNEQIESLFQPFNQVDTSISRRYGGTGLGLALSRKLAQALGGDVVVTESQPGRGCVFTVSLDTGPLSGAVFVSSLDQAVQGNKDVKSHQDINLHGARILLAEDTEDSQFLITHFLKRAGANVDVAVNGLEAYTKAKDGDHDIVLMDIQMPLMDGYLATKKLRSEGFAKPIIALTAHAMKEERQKSLGAGCDEHLTKPVDRVALLERVYSFVHAAPSSL
jgi:PAS domain S-box-containing protein